MLVFMNKDAYDKFRLSKEDYELQKELEKEQKKNAEKADTDKKKGKKKDDKKADKKEEKKDIDVQLDGIEDRIVRITPNSSEIADAIVDAEKTCRWRKPVLPVGFRGGLRSLETRLAQKEHGMPEETRHVVGSVRRAERRQVHFHSRLTHNAETHRGFRQDGTHQLQG